MSTHVGPGSSYRRKSSENSAPAENDQRWLPRRCTLDGFREEADGSEGMDLSQLEPLTRLRVQTHNTLYQLTILSPWDAKVIVQGGQFFAEPAEANLSGSSYGGCMLKTRWIGLGMRMEIYGKQGPIVTSPVRSVHTEDDSSLPGPF